MRMQDKFEIKNNIFRICKRYLIFGDIPYICVWKYFKTKCFPKSKQILIQYWTKLYNIASEFSVWNSEMYKMYAVLALYLYTETGKFKNEIQGIFIWIAKQNCLIKVTLQGKKGVFIKYFCFFPVRSPKILFPLWRC